MKKQKIFIGGWYQRTTIHLSEIFDFLDGVDSPLELDKEKLKKLRRALDIKKIEMRIDDFQHINLFTKNDLIIRIFEDGLIVLNYDAGDLKRGVERLKKYYEEKLSPALNYLFSLGAPIPKELANIKTVYPYFILLNKESKEKIEKILKIFKQKKYFEVINKTFQMYRGDKLYIVNNLSENDITIERIINEQIFVREFKSQLHRYLNLHRIIWEKIDKIKEKGEISGEESIVLKEETESYIKTVNLISNRINQMGLYVETRESVVKNDIDLEKITNILQFRYETLLNSLAYIKEIWETTNNYAETALKSFSDIQAKSAEASVKNLTVITTTGVVVGLLRAYNLKIPTFSLSNIIYFLTILFVGYFSNMTLQRISARKKYKIKDIKTKKDI